MGLNHTIEFWTLAESVRSPNLRRNISLDKLNIDRDVHHKHTGKMGTQKYLRENCYHSIECSVANSLAALMRK